ncbi:MAG: FtsH protease activity modulator HflK [Alphaproteobacteria bacterium]|nr:FtsH protease activity modulator HflK [Alphaproteobacteria bacterium]
MAWSNQGGGSGGPWGRGPQGPQPPDLEDLLKKGQERLKQFVPGGVGGGRGLAIIGVLVILVWALTGFYQVQPDEQGVELVFGKWVSTTQSGLNYNVPAPFGEVFTPKVTRVNRVEIGYRSDGSTSSSSAREVASESLMLTGDENIIDINFVVFWTINNAGKYLFNIRAPEATVKDVAESAIREVVGKTPIETAIAEGRSTIETNTQELMQRVLDTYGSGITITQVELQKVDPPAAVIDAYRDVQAALADRERLINQAETYRNSILPVAQGEASKLLQEAEAYKQVTINRALGEANRFSAVYDQYVLAKDVTVKRLYLETMQEILHGMNKVIIDSGAGTQGVLPYLPLPELARPAQSATGGTQ